MKKSTAEELIAKYINGQCTPEEKAAVESGFFQELQSNNQTINPKEVNDAVVRMRAIIAKRIHTRQRGSGYFSVPRLSIAASLLLVACITWYFNRSELREPLEKPESAYVNDVKPGGNKAYLMLDNGTRIALDEASNGKLTDQGGIIISKLTDGQLAYTVDNKGPLNDKIGYNTIETPRSGQYCVILPDGTKVWLNAASTITYPVRFTGNERRVKLSGEAYFEVAHNKLMPFRVQSNSQVVEVLGTHFNVNSYNDEAFVRTTLLEGAVYVAPGSLSGSQGVHLKPGQEALLGVQGIKVQQADIEAVTSWKNGDFIFKGEDLASIMRKVSKWYDVDVSYEKEMDGNVILSGFVSRSKNLSAILKTMELTGKVHFKIEGRRVTVMQ